MHGAIADDCMDAPEGSALGVQEVEQRRRPTGMWEGRVMQEQLPKQLPRNKTRGILNEFNPCFAGSTQATISGQY